MNTIPFANVRAFYTGTHPGGHWFDKGAMRWFKTRLPRVAYQGAAGTLFVTSETNPSGQTRFSVRVQKQNGDIDTVGEFHSFATRADAVAEIKRLMVTGVAV